MADQSNHDRFPGVAAPTVLGRAHRAFRVIDQLVRSIRIVEPIAKSFRFDNHEVSESLKHRLEIFEPVAAERDLQSSRNIFNPEPRMVRRLITASRIEPIATRARRILEQAGAIPMASPPPRALVAEGMSGQMNRALLFGKDISAAPDASRVSARTIGAIPTSAENLSVGIKLDASGSGARAGVSTRRIDVLDTIGKTHNAITKTIGTSVISEARARVPEFVEPMRENARSVASSATRGAVTINSSPTVVIHASETGANLEQQVTDALRRHRDDLLEQMTREAARRERGEY